MYSLYRAWLSLGPTCSPMNPDPLNLSVGPNMSNIGSNISDLGRNLSNGISEIRPNVNLSRLGDMAPNILAPIREVPDVTLQVGPTLTHFSAHRSVLTAHSGFFKAALSNQTGLTPIPVPNINVDEFSSLLTFMYTGYLDLNISNIYNILLATHILHMPQALEICRNYLLQQNNPQILEHRVNIIKPIASKKLAPPCQEIFTPVNFRGLKKSEDTPFKRVGEKLDFDNNARASISRQDKINSISDSSEKVSSKRNIVKGKEKIKKVELYNTPKDKTIVDIACCDGPVRFHRVLNKNYGIQDLENYERGEINQNEALNKVMNAGILEKLGGNNNENQNNDVFTCVYCNHTFKSQYCYQKHARRHLYPVSLDNSTQVEQKREVKLLDMNVQYYPCKTCGSKFPSYYFVHKHRKICHAEEEADQNHKNNVIEVEQAGQNFQNDSSCSAIDVEGEEGHENNVT